MSEELQELLPSPLQRDSNYRALNDLLDRAGALDLTKLLVYWLDIVDASALPVLAKQFHVMGLEGWEFAHTEAEQRALLKQAVELHRRKGTLWAVRQGVKRYDPDLDVQEWFEYGGQPYYFRLTGGTGQITLRQAVEMFHTVEALKSLRSKLEGGIEGREVIQHTSRFLTAVTMRVETESTRQIQGNAGASVLLRPFTRLEVNPARTQPPPVIKTGRAYCAAYTRIEVKLW